ncbi:CHAP domain-containing protein [Thermomonospora umbrina]|uniref:CHAP domain-containing protein n=1 Tax=Thermomonospora umbrina TaxID=111806 RepID=A0A3D9SGA6_9ACTN|nr:CHAP domain-containing protein [Thermomonospora umbrina]REE94717.1 CHAP domain-containing protein [Thermomonospora umbrina]
MDPIGKKLLDVAEKELGYTEKPDGYTKFGEWFAENVDADHDSYFETAPWCDMFLAWAADKAGVTDAVGQFASTVEHARWFEKNDAWGSEPEPGAIVFFDWNGSNDIDRIDHVGIVTKVDGKKIHTIEANVDGVHLKRKVRDGDVIAGYGLPSKVKVTAAPAAPEKYVPKHAAPAPRAEALTSPASGEQNLARTESTPGGPATDAQGLAAGGQDMVLGGLVAFAVVGTVALAVGKSAAAKVPASPPVRVRKRGKHHRRPVALPADITPAQLEAADASTTMMPVISAAVAAEAEDREFWGRIEHLKEDQELAFWDSLHAEFTAPGESAAPPAPAERPAAPSGGHAVPTSLGS